MKRAGKIKWLTAGIALILAIPSWVFADQNKGSGAVKLVKPELWIMKFKAERTGYTATGDHRVQIRVTVVNSAPGSVCANPFQVGLEKRSPGDASDSLGRGIYSSLGSQAVPRLCANAASAKLAAITLTFEDVVPADQLRTWRATADSSGVVDEGQEDNNQTLSDPYFAEAPCLGVDYVLTRIEIMRDRRGVWFKAFGKNRCIGNCPAAAWAQACCELVDPEVVDPGVCGALLGEGSRGAAWTGVPSRADCDLTYRVTIEFAGGACADINPANNTYNVILRAGEENKTVHCRF